MTSTTWAKVFSRAKIDVWESRYFTKKSARRTRRDAKRVLRRGRRRWERQGESQRELTGSESLPGR